MEKNYPVIFTAGDRKSTAESFDITEKGLGFYSNVEMDVGDSIELKILPKGESFSFNCDAIVRHVREHGGPNPFKYIVGAEFMEGLKDFATSQLIDGKEKIHVETSIIINASARDCYDAICNFVSYPKWLTVAKDAKVLERYPDRKPKTVEFIFDFIIKKIRVVNYYEYIEDDFVLTWETVEGDIKAQLGKYSFQELRSERTNAVVSGFFVAGFYVPKRAIDYITKVTLRKTIRALKDVVESGDSKKF